MNLRINSGLPSSVFATYRTVAGFCMTHFIPFGIFKRQALFEILNQPTMYIIPTPFLRILFLSVLSLFYFSDLIAQCDPPTQLPSVQCIDAPVTCMQDACYTTTNITANGWNGFCGNNTAIHNPQYFEIIPTDSCIEILIHVDNCSSGAPLLQAALVTSCEWQPCPGANVPCPDILDCDPGTPVGGTIMIEACGLTPGVSLWLIIDGNNGSICQYTIEFAEGIFEPQIDEEITSGSATPSSVCQGYEELLLSVSPLITGAHGYLWSLEWEDLMFTSTLHETLIDIAPDAPPGNWNVCAWAFSGCDTTEVPFCFQVEIFSINDVEKESETFCPEVFPFLWHTITITGPGTYTESFIDTDGCSYDSIWVVEAYPEVPVGEINITHCFNENFDPFGYEGQVYYDPGSYELVYPGMGLNGCDSFAVLNLTLEGVAIFIENSCVEGQSYLSPHILEIIPVNDSISYQWYDCGFTELLSTEETLQLDSSGCYCLIASSEACSDTICSTYYGNPCESSCLIVPAQSCIGDSVLLTINGGDILDATFHWLVDVRGEEDVYFSGNDSLWVMYDTAGCYRVSVTIVDDTSSITCIDSICISPPPTEVSLCCDSIICQECVPLTFILTGNAPWTIILSDGNSLDTITGIVTTPFNHVVCVYESITNFTIVEAYGSGDQCSALISNDSVEIQYYNPWPCPDCPFFYQEDTLLCASTDLSDYKWTECNDTIVLATTQCFMPPASGCYCLTAFATDQCELTSCMDITVATIGPNSKSEYSVLPNPTNGSVHIDLSSEIDLPVHWKLYDQLGTEYQNGIIHESISRLDFGNQLPSGVYFIKIGTGQHELGITKLIIE